MSNNNPHNLLRHLWLLRFPGLLAAAVYLKSASALALLYLGLEFYLVLAAAVTILWLPPRVAVSLPRPQLNSWNLLQLAVYLLAGAGWLALAWLLLGLGLERKGADRAPQV